MDTTGYGIRSLNHTIDLVKIDLESAYYNRAWAVEDLTRYGDNVDRVSIERLDKARIDIAKLERVLHDLESAKELLNKYMSEQVTA
ncbi:hypothetical protein EQG49_02515 [Periweissella cryptocerci]|uniref:Uncharacterized protein n=1 Tax=Periweissella cryptocerci TaxID=2506420 RepID=A0A4P6YS07_9LACO|nr:hypothetical protein [Periweissella cryptocerci]QBO35416.1 hypothetical protein EQG49_02515 [Periweissella cryptocerci]